MSTHNKDRADKEQLRHTRATGEPEEALILLDFAAYYLAHKPWLEVLFDDFLREKNITECLVDLADKFK